MGKAQGGGLQGEQMVLQPTPPLLPTEVGIPGPYWGAGQQDLVWDGHRLGFTQGGPTGGTYSEGSSTGRAMSSVLSVHPHSFLLEILVRRQAGRFTP